MSRSPRTSSPLPRDHGLGQVLPLGEGDLQAEIPGLGCQGQEVESGEGEGFEAGHGETSDRVEWISLAWGRESLGLSGRQLFDFEA